MRRWGGFSAAIVVASLALPGVALAQTEDSVTGRAGFGGIQGFAFDAQSGPSGEDPSGTVQAITGTNTDTAPVICLAVHGHRAIIGVQPAFGPNTFVTFVVEDNNGAGSDRLGVEFSQSPIPPTCSEDPATRPTTPIAVGDLHVVDAQPLPTTKDQCKNGGWRSYATFKNQGKCVAFVIHQAVRACVFEREAHGRRAFREKYGKGRFDLFAFLSCVRQRLGD